MFPHSNKNKQLHSNEFNYFAKSSVKLRRYRNKLLQSFKLHKSQTKEKQNFRVESMCFSKPKQLKSSLLGSESKLSNCTDNMLFGDLVNFLDSISLEEGNEKNIFLTNFPTEAGGNISNKRVRQQSNLPLHLKTEEPEPPNLKKLNELDNKYLKYKIRISNPKNSYNNIGSFAEKFNKDLSSISNAYGKFESKVKFVENPKLKLLWQHKDTYDDYKTVKQIECRAPFNYKFKLQPLIPNSPRLLDRYGDKFFKMNRIKGNLPRLVKERSSYDLRNISESIK